MGALISSHKDNKDRAENEPSTDMSHNELLEVSS